MALGREIISIVPISVNMRYKIIMCKLTDWVYSENLKPSKIFCGPPVVSEAGVGIWG
jgi:hypothetical protein